MSTTPIIVDPSQVESITVDPSQVTAMTNVTPAAAIASGASPAMLQVATQAEARQQVTSTPVVPPPTNAFGIPANEWDAQGNPVIGHDKNGQPIILNAKKFVNTVGPMEVTGALGLVGEGVGAGIDELRAARAAKVLQSPGEWQRINDVLNVPKSGITVSPQATSAAQAATMPGRTLAGLGYSAKDLQEMDPFVRMNLVDAHRSQIGAAISDAVGAASKTGRTLDVGSPESDVLKQIADPEIEAKVEARFAKIGKDLGIEDFRKVTPEQAWQLSRAIDARFASGYSGVESVGGISKQLASAVRNQIKGALPESAKLFQQYSDLREATDAAVEGMQNTLRAAPPPTTLQKVGRFAVQKVLPKVIAYGAGGAGAALGYNLLKDMRGGEP